MSDLEQLARETAEAVNQKNAERGHVLRANNGETAPVMATAELADFILSALRTAVEEADKRVRRETRQEDIKQFRDWLDATPPISPATSQWIEYLRRALDDVEALAVNGKAGG